MKAAALFPVLIVIVMLIIGPTRVCAQVGESTAVSTPTWHGSIQFLGITYHPDGGTTPEVYPLKFDRKAYLVLDVGLAANLDYRLADYSFIRFTTSLYQDCAFVTAGCFHLGPRLQYSWGRNAVNVGIGPILSFRQDWHRFKEYVNDDFYGDRVYHGWQYRFFPTALEFEYLRRINENMEFQYSLVPGAPLVITSMFGIRFRL